MVIFLYNLYIFVWIQNGCLGNPVFPWDVLSYSVMVCTNFCFVDFKAVLMTVIHKLNKSSLGYVKCVSGLLLFTHMYI